MYAIRIERHQMTDITGQVIEYYRAFYLWGGAAVLPQRLSADERARAVNAVVVADD